LLKAALPAAVVQLTRAAERGADIQELLDSFKSRQTMSRQFTEAYPRYCWPVNSVSDLKLAPFHIMATEGAVHTGKNHVWHIETLSRLCAAGDGVLLPTPYLTIDLSSDDNIGEGVRWWRELTDRRGEGMVVKPLDFVMKGSKGLVQPAVKCRGREYLRIIYGPEYTAPENLARLRSRGVSRKRSLALREFALGIEGLACWRWRANRWTHDYD